MLRWNQPYQKKKKFNSAKFVDIIIPVNNFLYGLASMVPLLIARIKRQFEVNNSIILRESIICWYPILVFQGGRISFGGQLQNYQNTVSQLVNILGDEDTAANYLSKCIYSVGLGSNDYLNNYFMPQYYSSSSQFTPEQYADELIRQYSQQLRVSMMSSTSFPFSYSYAQSLTHVVKLTYLYTIKSHEVINLGHTMAPMFANATNPPRPRRG